MQATSIRPRYNRVLRFICFIISLALVVAAALYAGSLRDAGEVVLEYASPGNIYSIAFTPDGSRAFYSLTESKVLAVDSEQNVLFEIPLPKSGLSVKVIGDMLYVGCDDRHIYVYDLDGNPLADIKDSYRISAVSGDAKDRILAGVSNTATKNRIRMYDFSGEVLWEKDPRTYTQDIYLYPEGDRFLTITRSAQIGIYTADADMNALASVKLDYTPYCWAIRPDANMIVIGDEGNWLYVYDMQLNPLTDPIQYDERISGVDVDAANETILLVFTSGRLDTVGYDGAALNSLTVLPESRKVYANSGTGQAVVLNKINEKIQVINTESHADAARNETVSGYMVYVIAALSLLTAISAVNLFPSLSGRMWPALWRGVKLIFSHRISYLMMLPTIALLLVFKYYPAIRGLYLAFFDYVPGIRMRFVGWDNFRSMMSNNYFWTGVNNMLIFLVTDMIKALVPPILFAELILAMRSKGGQYWTRVALYLPGILPGVAGLLVWGSGILGINGVLNGILKALGIIRENISWLGDERTAIWGLVLIGFPWVGSYIIFYGALISVPTSLFESAKIDGCPWWKRILSIDVPLIGPQIKYVFVTGFIASVQEFGRSYILTMGGPGTATYTPMLELYYNMSKFQNYGIAAAMGLSMFVVLLTATIFNLRLNIGGDAAEL